MVSIADIEAAQARISGIVKQTPIFESRLLNCMSKELFLNVLLPIHQETMRKQWPLPVGNLAFLFQFTVQTLFHPSKRRQLSFMAPR